MIDANHVFVNTPYIPVHTVADSIVYPSLDLRNNVKEDPIPNAANRSQNSHPKIAPTEKYLLNAPMTY